MTTIDEDSAELGLTGAEVIALRRTQPWIMSWASRFGAGAEHLRAWLDAGRPVVDRSIIDVAGDPQIVAVVREVIAILPAPVAWRLVTGRVQIRCGRDHCERIPDPCRGFVDRTRDPLYVGVLVADAEVAAHELGHAWGHKPSFAFTCVPLNDEQRESLRAGLLADAVERGIDRELEDETMRAEMAADRLASLWLGRDVNTTRGALGEHRRQRMRSDIERIVAGARDNDGAPRG